MFSQVFFNPCIKCIFHHKSGTISINLMTNLPFQRSFEIYNWFKQKKNRPISAINNITRVKKKIRILLNNFITKQFQKSQFQSVI